MRLSDWLSVSFRVVVLSCLVPSVASAAPRVWSGLTTSFTKPAGASPQLPENQDHITANVALTRANTGGVFNVLAESFYGDFSPADTEWATDINNPGETIAAAKWRNLDFTAWVYAYGGFSAAGNNVVDRDAVVHLITDDIYLDLQFTQWGMGFGNGGSFSYQRADVPEPTTMSLLAVGLLGLFALGTARRAA